MPPAAVQVFLVDDEPAIAEAVSFALQAEGYGCKLFATGSACVDALGNRGDGADPVPALILLDIGLPDASGFEVFRRIRQLSQVPIVFLTARKEEIDRVVGLEMGADDYIVKPFSLRELVARVRMVIRRGAHHAAVIGTQAAVTPATQPPARPTPFSHDPLRKQMSYCGQPLDLTLHEYRLLEALLKHPGRVYSRDQLLDLAWEAPDHRLERTVDSHIKSLRAKLREANPNTDPIRTHRGMGYSLEVDG